MTDVVIVSHSHPALKHGGGEVAAYRQYQHLREQGVDATFVGAVIGYEESHRFLGPDQRAVSLSDSDFLIRSHGMDAFMMDQPDPEFETWLTNFFTRLDADIYHFHHFWNIGAGTIRRLRAARPDALMLCTLHEFTAICANHGQMVKTGSNRLCYEAETLACATCVKDRPPIDHMLRRSRMTDMLAQFDHLISPSHFLRQRFIEWGIAPDRISMIENGVPFERGGLRPSAERLKELSSEFAVFCQATPTKGLDVLVEAARLIEAEAQVSTITINVFGSSEEEFAAIWPEIEIPTNVRFHGRYAPENVIKLMSTAGWILMPSVWWENSPVIIQEALAAQVP
ncbi:MAG: glycosyltransferase, partial [Pseudomonadota bacterium]